MCTGNGTEGSNPSLSAIESDKNLNLIERPEYKWRWNTEPWAKRQQEALRKWLLARLEGYFFEGERVCQPDAESAGAARTFTAAARPHLASANQLADVVHSDTKFLEAAEVYEGISRFSVSKLIRDLVTAESVPFLPVHRYKPTGLRKRHDWEETWNLQRWEDEIEAKVRAQYQVIAEPSRESADDEVGSGDRVQDRGSEVAYTAKNDEPALTETQTQTQERIRAAQQEEVGAIPVPPKYVGKDFVKTTYWKLRGKLDVPKERWISYPGAERAGDDSLIIAWAGWDHLQQAQALAEFYLAAKENQGWPAEHLKPLLAGLADLIPWLKQWHNTPDPAYGMGLGDYFAGFLEEQCRALDLTVEEVDKARFGESESVRR